MAAFWVEGQQVQNLKLGYYKKIILEFELNNFIDRRAAFWSEELNGGKYKLGIGALQKSYVRVEIWKTSLM